MNITQGWIQGISTPYTTGQDNLVALVLVLCFILTALALAQSKKFLIQQGKNFILHKERISIFSTATTADVRYLVLLVVLSCVLMGVYFLHYFSTACPELFQKSSSAILLGLYVGIILLYVGFKITLYAFIGWIFFDRTIKSQWIESYLTILYYIGTLFFIPITACVYLHLGAYWTLGIGAFSLFAIKILTFYKLFKFFFRRIDDIFLLILYFCALEIIPCLLVYKVLSQMNSLLLIKF